MYTRARIFQTDIARTYECTPSTLRKRNNNFATVDPAELCVYMRYIILYTGIKQLMQNCNNMKIIEKKFS